MLQRALPVRFGACPDGTPGRHDALVRFTSPADSAGVSCDCPALTFAGGGGSRVPVDATVDLTDSGLLEPVLRGRRLPESDASLEGPLVADPGLEVLATVRGRPVWARDRRAAHTSEVTTLGCARLGAEEPLRNALGSGRFAALLPLLHFLRGLTAGARWEPPGLRAAYMLDDLNLHAASYGRVRLPALAEHARVHDYHVVVATIPLDLPLPAHPRAVRAFRAAREHLSLTIHGARHDGAEFVKRRPVDAWQGILAQAIDRTKTFERRTGIGIDRVMVPPHGVCSPESLVAMARVGIEATCTFWAFPESPGSPPADWPLAGWDLAQLHAGGMPVIQRWPMVDHPREDLVFRALLGQPLILYGHQHDLVGGLDLLAEMTEYVNGLGAVRWATAGQIAHSNMLTRREGSTLRVRPYTLRARLRVPSGVERLVIEPVPAYGWQEPPELIVKVAGKGQLHGASDAGATAVDLDEGTDVVEIAARPARSAAPPRAPRRRTALLPIARRAASEARDRLDPLVGRQATSTG